jgi:hypothetical protein
LLSMQILIVLLLTCCLPRSVHFLQLIMAVAIVLTWLFGVCLSRPLAERSARDAFGRVGGGRSRYVWSTDCPDRSY